MAAEARRRQARRCFIDASSCEVMNRELKEKLRASRWQLQESEAAPHAHVPSRNVCIR